jgi:hypothetical protein
MLYGSGREISGGALGRWHRERLSLSPYLYRFSNGTKVWNRGFFKDGYYQYHFVNELSSLPGR